MQSNLHKTWSLCNIISVILTFFHLTIFLKRKNSVRCLLKTKLLMNRSWSEVAFFIRPLCFYVEGRALIFFCPKKFVKWKQVQITNTNDSTKTSGPVQVWIHPDNDFVPIMEPPSFCWTSQNTQHSMRMQSLNYKPLPGTIEVSFNIWLANYCVRISYYFTREKCYDICFSNQLKPFRSQKVQNKIETKY